MCKYTLTTILIVVSPHVHMPINQSHMTVCRPNGLATGKLVGYVVSGKLLLMPESVRMCKYTLTTILIVVSPHVHMPINQSHMTVCRPNGLATGKLVGYVVSGKLLLMPESIRMCKYTLTTILIVVSPHVHMPINQSHMTVCRPNGLATGKLVGYVLSGKLLLMPESIRMCKYTLTTILIVVSPHVHMPINQSHMTVCRPNGLATGKLVGYVLSGKLLLMPESIRMCKYTLTTILIVVSPHVHMPINQSHMTVCRPNGLATGKLVGYVVSGKLLLMPESVRMCKYTLTTILIVVSPHVHMPINQSHMTVCRPNGLATGKLVGYVVSGKLLLMPESICMCKYTLTTILIVVSPRVHMPFNQSHMTVCRPHGLTSRKLVGYVLTC